MNIRMRAVSMLLASLLAVAMAQDQLCQCRQDMTLELQVQDRVHRADVAAALTSLMLDAGLAYRANALPLIPPSAHRPPAPAVPHSHHDGPHSHHTHGPAPIDQELVDSAEAVANADSYDGGPTGGDQPGMGSSHSGHADMHGMDSSHAEMGSEHDMGSHHGMSSGHDDMGSHHEDMGSSHDMGSGHGMGSGHDMGPGHGMGSHHDGMGSHHGMSSGHDDMGSRHEMGSHHGMHKSHRHRSSMNTVHPSDTAPQQGRKALALKQVRMQVPLTIERVVDCHVTDMDLAALSVSLNEALPFVSVVSITVTDPQCCECDDETCAVPFPYGFCNI